MTSLAADWNPSLVLPVFLALGTDVLIRAQSIPTLGPFSAGWPGFLLSLLARTHPAPPHELPATVINASSGYARTNRAATLEHLLHSNSPSRPSRRGLTLTFLYTSRPLYGPKTLSDSVGWSAAGTIAAQLAAAATLYACGIASASVPAATVAGTLLSTVGTRLLRAEHDTAFQAARTVPAQQREVVCLTSGNGSAEVVVVVSEGGGVKVEDVATARAGHLGISTALGGAVLLALWTGLLAGLATLGRMDAWCVLAVGALGTAQTAYAARTWRGSGALGFRFVEERKRVVHADKVMEALMEAEDVESGVGLALLPVFFPGPLRPKEEEWWAARKTSVKSV